MISIKPAYESFFYDLTGSTITIRNKDQLAMVMSLVNKKLIIRDEAYVEAIIKSSGKGNPTFNTFCVQFLREARVKYGHLH